MSEQKSISKSAVLNLLKTFFSLVFPLITFPYSSRVLGPCGIGKVQFAQSVVAYFSMFAALGIQTYGIREAAKVRDNKVLLSKFVKEIFSINIISTLISYMLLLVALLYMPKLVEYRKLVIYCSGTILFTTLGVDWLYSALEEYTYITVRSLIFQLISILLLFLTVKTSDDYLNYAMISIISSVGSNVCNFIHARKFVYIKLDKQRLELKKHLKPIFVLFSMSVAVSVYTVLDTSMLGFITNDIQIGYYNAATKINKLVLTMVTSVGAVFLPRLSYYTEKNQLDSFGKLTDKGLKFLLMTTLPSSVGLCLLGKPILLLFSGAQYLPALMAMQIMNPIIIIIAISGFIGMQIFMPLRKEKLTLISVLIGAVVNFSLNMILIPAYGAVGAAVATLCAELCVTCVQLFMAKSFFYWKSIIIHFLQCVIATIIMALFICLINKIFSSIVLNIIIGVFTGIFVYGVILLLLKNDFLIFVIKHLMKFKDGKNEV